MPETPSGHEYASPQPPQGGNGAGDERPGYPPAGHEEARDTRAAAEAADRAGEDPEAVLASLEAGTETPEQRQQRLGEFVDTYFLDEVKPAARTLAIEECQGFENDCRELFEEPELRLGKEDASDPELKEKLATLNRPGFVGDHQLN